MPHCCGSERTTPFCPMCGKSLHQGYEQALLQHAAVHAAKGREALVEARASGGERAIDLRMTTVLKWEAWELFVRRASAAGVTCEEDAPESEGDCTA